MTQRALRLVAHVLKPINDLDDGLLDGEKMIQAAEIAKRNKVFLAFYEGLTRAGLEIPELVQEMAEREAKRKRLYDEALAEVVEAAERRGVEFMVFKTIKPFTYVGDDIDFFLHDKNSFKLFTELLKDMRYLSMGGGPPEETLVKEVCGIHIMADVHKAFSASYIPYVDATRVWRRRVRREFNGLRIFTPSLNDEVLILAGHSLLKEFRINLAEFLHATMLLPKVHLNEIDELAEMEKMSYAMKIFVYIANQIHEMLYREDLLSPNFNVLDNDYLLGAVHTVVKKDLKDGVRMPYSYPMYLPVIAYFDKLRVGIVTGGKESLSLLLSLIKAPFTGKEGINILWNYLAKRIA